MAGSPPAPPPAVGPTPLACAKPAAAAGGASALGASALPEGTDYGRLLPADVQLLLMDSMLSRRDAMHLASTCKAFRAVLPLSIWPLSRPDGMVLLPPSGRAWREVSPGDDLQAAVDACPEGGAIRLRPGAYPLRWPLRIEREVHVFGSLSATLRATDAHTVELTADVATLDGLVLEQIARPDSGDVPGCALWIEAGRARVQGCEIGPAMLAAVGVQGDDTAPTLVGCRLHGGKNAGLTAWLGARPRLERCCLEDSAGPGVIAQRGGHPTLASACVVRRHAGEGGWGVYVAADGDATLEASTAFQDNEQGDSVFVGKWLRVLPA